MEHSNRIRPRIVRAIAAELGVNGDAHPSIRKMLAYIGPARFKEGGPFRAEAMRNMAKALGGGVA